MASNIWHAGLICVSPASWPDCGKVRSSWMRSGGGIGSSVKHCDITCMAGSSNHPFDSTPPETQSPVVPSRVTQRTAQPTAGFRLTDVRSTHEYAHERASIWMNATAAILRLPPSRSLLQRSLLAGFPVVAAATRRRAEPCVRVLFGERDARDPAAFRQQLVLDLYVPCDRIRLAKLLMVEIFAGRPRHRIVAGGEPSLGNVRFLHVTARRRSTHLGRHPTRLQRIG